MPAISTIAAFPDYATLSSGDTLSHSDHNTVRTSSKTYLDDYKSVMTDLEKNYASSSQPTDKPQGKVWADTTVAATAILKFYYNGSGNLDSLCSLAAVETLTGAKTFTGGVTITTTALSVSSAATFTGGVTISTAALTVSLATDSTSTTTGAITDAGGMGLGKALWVGGLANFATNVYIGGSTVPAGSPAKLLILETGAVLGTAATGFTMIGHVATDILDVTVGATTTGKVRVNNTTTSTSVSTGAIVNAGGQGIAGPLWVGGLANIAGVLTLQTGAALTGTLSGTPTVSGSWIFEASQTQRLAGASVFPQIAQIAYSAATSSRAQFAQQKSASNTLGTVATTADGDILAYNLTQGVNAAGTPAFVTATYIQHTQTGAAGASFIGADIQFGTATAAAAAAAAVFITSEKNLTLSAAALRPTSAVRNIVLSNSSAVLGAATADMVSLACIDIAGAAGNAGLVIQPEGAAYFGFGLNAYIGAAAPTTVAGLVAGVVVGGSTDASGNPTDAFAIWAKDWNGAGTRWPYVRSEAGEVGYQTISSTPLPCKVIDIGDWNMDSTSAVVVAHGLTLSKIRSVLVMVRDDADAAHYDSNGNDGASTTDLRHATDATDVTIVRTAASIFDAVGFDSTSFNRGWILIWYIP